ncbi:hypothetical protein NAT51_06080 [Flavobacterium amniphilum]|uniref:hypothetical protein n=1 Tax=Flavobacterium amniphilum TaxID=1834035 RepID=UPI00202A01AB|nr:hypothetical protein [Flavobacterium amniphilum]MCL9805077.1 hypothetical protein [Flavobacterium amniphilum]
MKSHLTLFLLLANIAVNARFSKATILFNDGHTETGLVRSFLEQRILTAGYSTNLEHELNLDDKIVKFKVSENAEVKDLSIDDIKQITLLYENNYTAVYRVLALKEIDNKGNLRDKSLKVFLPLLKEGKINIYGLRYSGRDSSGSFQEEAFYYQNAKDDYAINYYNVGLFSLFSMKERILNPFRQLFSDCPSAVTEIENMEKKFLSSTKEDLKASREEQKQLTKEFNNLSKEEKKDLLKIHHYKFNMFEKMISHYEKCQ